jgi:hypothetical protein
MRRSLFTTILSAAGVLLTCVTGALLVSFHAPLRSEVNANWFDGAPLANMSLYHFASADCRCSQQLMEHLLSRSPRQDSQEVLVYIGARQPIHTRLAAAGYGLRFEATPEASGVQAAPWLVVRDASGRVRYSGGYEAAPYWEQRILFHVEHHERQASLPTTGCATSQKLRTQTLAYRLKDLLPLL